MQFFSEISFRYIFRFRTESIASIVKSRGFDPNMTTDNVMIEVEDSKQQEHVLDNIDLSLLNSEINKRIINPISKRLYKTTCIRCDDNLLSGG